MKIIQESALEAAIDKFDSMDDDEAQTVIDDLAHSQPFLLAYAFAVEDEFDDEDAFNLFLEYLAIVWLAFSSSIPNIPQISEQEVIDKDERLQAETIRFSELPESEMIEAALEKYGNPSQPVIMSYLYQQLMDLQEDEEVDDESASAIITNLTFAVELLDEVINKPGLRIV